MTLREQIEQLATAWLEQASRKGGQRVYLTGDRVLENCAYALRDALAESPAANMMLREQMERLERYSMSEINPHEYVKLEDVLRVLAERPAETPFDLLLDPPLYVDGEPAYNSTALFSFIGNAVRLRGSVTVTAAPAKETP